MQFYDHGNYRALATASVAALFICFTSLPAYSAEDNFVKFGVLAPLTGVNAIQGADMVKGFKFAIERINEGYDVSMKGAKRITIGPGLLGHAVTYEVQDTGGRPQSGLAAARKLIFQSNVTALLGTYSSGVTVPVGQLANEKEVVMFDCCTTSPQLRKIGPYFFDAMALDTIAGQAIGKFAYKDSGATRFASISMNNPFGVGIQIQSCEAISDLGSQCVTVVKYRGGKANYKADLRRLMTRDPGAVLFTAFGQDARLILSQAYELGIDVSNNWYAPYMTMWSNEVAQHPKVAEGIKGFVVGASGRFFRSEFGTPFEKRFGHSPKTAFSAYLYDATMLTALAIQKAGSTDPDAIRKAIPAVTSEYRGVTGDKTVDSDGMQISADYQWKIFYNGSLQDYSLH